MSGTRRKIGRGTRGIVSILAVVFLILFIGCAIKTIKPENLICNNVSEDSYSIICSVSEYVCSQNDHVCVQPEDLGNVFKFANTVGLGTDTYTALKAKKFVNDIREFLVDAQQTGLAYNAFAEFVEMKYGELPQKVKLVIVLLKEFKLENIGDISWIDKDLSDYDYRMLFRHLDEQDEIINQFLMLWF